MFFSLFWFCWRPPQICGISTGKLFNCLALLSKNLANKTKFSWFLFLAVLLFQKSQFFSYAVLFVMFFIVHLGLLSQKSWNILSKHEIVEWFLLSGPITISQFNFERFQLWCHHLLYFVLLLFVSWLQLIICFCFFSF